MKKIVLFVFVIILCSCESHADVKIETPVIIPYEVYESSVFASEKFGVPVENVIAMILVENRSFDSRLRSSTRDSGMCQINDAILKDFYSCGFTDVYDLQQNVEFGTMRLRWAYNSCHDWHKVYMIYNLGSPKAKKMWKKGINRTNYSNKCMKYISTKDQWKVKAEDEKMYSLNDYDIIMWD